MSIENVTTIAVEKFEKSAKPSMFMTDLFKDNGASTQSKIQIDIVRGEERVAIDVVPGTGPDGQKKRRPYVSKEYVTPAYDESYIFAAEEVNTRLAGKNAFDPVDIEAQVSSFFTESMVDGQDRIDRAVELQAVECLTTGIVTFQNNESLDFKAKSSHFPSAAAVWSIAGSDGLADLAALSNIIRKDSLARPDTLIFGDTALTEFLALDQIKDKINFRRANMIEIVPPRPLSAEKGAVFHGVVTVGSYEFQVWAYPQFHVDSADGVEPVTKVEYLNPGKVIMFSSAARLDRYYGNIPRFTNGNIEGAQAVNFGSIMSVSKPVKTAPYVFMGNRGQAIEVGVRSRPLIVPTDIDSFGTLTV